MEDAVLNFSARYEDYNSDAIEITFKNRKKYEFYKKHVAIFKMTGTWCVNCPGMTSALDQLNESMPDKFYEIALHASSNSGTDPFHTNATALFSNAMGGLYAFPTAVFNLRKTTATSNTSSTNLRNALENELLDPAICAIKATTTYDAARQSVTINAGLVTDKGGVFELAYILVKDGLIAEQTGASSDYVHNATAIALSNNFLGTDGKFTLGAGEEKLQNITLTSAMEIDPKDTRVLVYAIATVDGQDVVNNIISIPIGDSVTTYVENND